MEVIPFTKTTALGIESIGNLSESLEMNGEGGSFTDRHPTGLKYCGIVKKGFRETPLKLFLKFT
ncbi:hypothetical protein AKJ40_02295 [candidate division MSBL1 archaeon SCGC-AAA259M10]|uniref:Uncharacterized protein n=1 Tax=candidate division MSBL1 archaeon SCGC-AAA259M10 TaxID=1698270 RepID=A0A133V0A9_9EURY|nr:hypothetical protein AKJ40_02295 [candidate division MSBL1 archaeon SCGC-AAA259M10]